MREINSKSLKAEDIFLEGLSSAEFDVNWINPWNGKIVLFNSFSSQGKKLMLKLPQNYTETDIAFIIKLKK